MPTGPKGEKRPADAIGNAIKIAQIATGEIKDEIKDDGRAPAVKALGAKGGKKRAQNLSPKRRQEIARRAAKARWKNQTQVQLEKKEH
jgi:hypothetical protein